MSQGGIEVAWAPLSRDQVVSVIEGQSCAPRVPIQIHLWVHAETFGNREDAVRRLLARYPADVQIVPFVMPGVPAFPGADPSYCWAHSAASDERMRGALDEQVTLADWSGLDEVLEDFPSAEHPVLLSCAPESDGRYRLGHWWFCLFERHWSLRGMTNALMDYYLHPEEVHRLFRALTDFYLVAIERGAHEQALDGILTSDDLGTQTGPFVAPAVFREFMKPYYRELIERAHELGMHFWMHACGNVEPFVADWVEVGLDVLHPIQKHTMSEQDIASRFGDRLTVFAGLDVQQIIPWGTPEEVRAEVRYLLDTFWRPGEGRCILTAGNGINQDCQLASLEAFFDEALVYGSRLVST